MSSTNKSNTIFWLVIAFFVVLFAGAACGAIIATPNYVLPTSVPANDAPEVATPNGVTPPATPGTPSKVEASTEHSLQEASSGMVDDKSALPKPSLATADYNKQLASGQCQLVTASGEWSENAEQNATLIADSISGLTVWSNFGYYSSYQGEQLDISYRGSQPLDCRYTLYDTYSADTKSGFKKVSEKVGAGRIVAVYLGKESGRTTLDGILLGPPQK